MAEVIRYRPLFFTSSRQGLSLNLELTRAQFRHPTRPTPHLVPGLVTVALYGFYVGTGDSNWGPRACAAGTTEPRPSLKSLNLKNQPTAEVGVTSQLELPCLSISLTSRLGHAFSTLAAPCGKEGAVHGPPPSNYSIPPLSCATAYL